MGRKSQRKKERHAQKRKEKKKKQEQSQNRLQGLERRAEIALGGNTRHRERVAQQVPKAWPGELPEDAAVFDDAALAALSPETAEQVTAVREALREASESRGADAVRRLSAISRSSPLSEWRLFVRGYVDWLAGGTDAAREAWQRLDAERRPGRIATVMMLALRDDLEQAVPAGQPQEPDRGARGIDWQRFDPQQLYHAKLLRRVRLDRSALRVAAAGLNVPEEHVALRLGPRKLEWLRRYIAEYQPTEPELTAALAQTALERAFSQNYSDVFDEATRIFPGPRHDRRNLLLTFLYYSRFTRDSDAERRAEQALKEYLDRDLPGNEELSKPLRKAMVSQIHLNEALELIQPRNRAFRWFYADQEDTKAIRDHLRAAAKAEPANRMVYRKHADWIESKLDDDWLTKPKRAPLERELAEVMRKWSKNLPDDTEPRLWLVDYLLENEELEEARPHVDHLAASRQDDPRVRATPWKWQLLEAMRLCRRKAWLAEAPARLDEAESLWPAWLPKQWLPYLRAAWLLRSGQTEAFEEQRAQICRDSGIARDSLADACMMLGAAQRMRVPAAELKPFRTTLDKRLKELDTLPIEDFFEVGSFFWDLQRAQMVYPAYRMHGQKIGKAMMMRLEEDPRRISSRIDDERMLKSILWGSEHRFWPTDYSFQKPPTFFSEPAAKHHPVFMAAKLNLDLKQRFGGNARDNVHFGPALREAAQHERDAYLRHWYLRLAERLDDVMADLPTWFSSSRFETMFGDDADDDDELDEDDFDDGEDDGDLW